MASYFYSNSLTCSRASITYIINTNPIEIINKLSLEANHTRKNEVAMGGAQTHTSHIPGKCLNHFDH